MHLTDSHVYQCTIDFYMWSVACSIVYARTCVTLAKWSRISLQAIVASHNLMVSCEAHWNIAERPQLWCLYHLPHFPRLSLTQSVVFSWDHTHQVCLALVLQCSLASQLPLWPCSVYSPSNNLYCDEHTIVFNNVLFVTLIVIWWVLVKVCTAHYVVPFLVIYLSTSRPSWGHSGVVSSTAAHALLSRKSVWFAIL